MKKILSVLCVVAMIASLACVSAFAADTFTVKVVLDDVKPGDTTVNGKVVGNLASGSLSSFGLELTWDGDTMELAKKAKDGAAKGTYTYSQNVTDNPYTILWVAIDTNEGDDTDYAATSPDAPVNVQYGVDYVVASFTMNLKAPAEEGQEINVGLAFMDGNGANDLNDTAVAASAVPGAVVVAADAPVTDAPATDAPATDAPATDAPATDAPATDAPATDAPATDAPATDAPATDAPATEAPATQNNNKTPATGDMTVLAVVLMVVALGAAVVVKKVNVK